MIEKNSQKKSDNISMRIKGEGKMLKESKRLVDSLFNIECMTNLIRYSCHMCKQSQTAQKDRATNSTISLTSLNF